MKQLPARTLMMSRPRSASARSISKNLSIRLMMPSLTERYTAFNSRSTCSAGP